MRRTFPVPRRLARREIFRLLLVGGAGSILAACGGNRPQKEQPPVGGQKAGPSGPKEGAGNPPVNTPAAGAGGPALAATPAAAASGQVYLAVAHGDDPAAITEAALKALGGIEEFVRPGFDVIIKPNICTDYYSYEYGATTNPAVVAALVRLALGAGAKRVRVMDLPFGGSCESAYLSSGIREAVEEAGGEMEIMNRNKFKTTPIPGGTSLTECKIYQDVLKCDLLINVPVVKHHNLARLTAGQKNLMGVIQNRQSIHAKMERRIPELVSVVRPGLTVVDAVRVLMDHGPTGGNLDDVRMANMVIASRDIVAADAYCAPLINMKAEDIPYIKTAAEMGLGTMDLSSIKIEEINA